MSKNKWWLKGGRGSGRTFRLLWEAYENKIANLERKNRLLGERCNQLLKDKGNLTDSVKYSKDQLTKAKEILKMIVDYYPCYNKTITEQAEQFLKDTTEQFLQNINTTNKSSDECKEPQGDWVVRTEEPL